MAKLFSWARYPTYAQTPHVSVWRGDVHARLTQVAKAHGSTLPFGNGRSYGDSCLSASNHVLHMRLLDRFIKADWTTGILVAEAGVSLHEVLRFSIPNGWFLPVTPGTKYVTLGGAVANDVHGKNHHRRGTFGCHVRQFGLVRSDASALICSPQHNSELYAATIGGLGLTGVIDWVELQLVPIRSSEIDATHIRFNSLDEFFTLSVELDSVHEYTVAWIDCVAKGGSVGRGVYIVGDHADSGRLVYQDAHKWNLPLTPPLSLINQLSLRLFNSLYYRAHKPGRNRSRIDYEPFFYPLDRILNWNRIYGPRGFQQYQCVIPEHDSAKAIADLLKAIARAHQGSFLAVLKRFGHKRSPGLLSFPLPGITLALDFPEQGMITAELFEKLDAIVRTVGGRLYPAKDAHMLGVDFRAAYPGWERLEVLRDPALTSHFWQRVTAS